MSLRRNIRFAPIKQRGDFQSWKDKLVNVPAFVLGNGPSLNDVDLAPLSNYFSIGINRSFYKLDSTVLLWQDVGLWFTERKNLLPLQAIKVCSDTSDPENRFFHFRLETGNFQLPTKPDILFGRGSSGPLAVQLAYILGCNPIILLGCDCKSRGTDTDFYGNNRFHTPTTMPQCLTGLNWIKNEVHDKGIRNVISCSDNDVFERKSIEQVIEQLDPKHKQDRSYWRDILL